MMICEMHGNTKKSEKNIVLIGMPGSGKSTAGPRLARMLNYEHYDLDNVIKDLTGLSPKDIVSSKGRDFFLEKQSDAVNAIPHHKAVVSTGGGIIYSEGAIENLKKHGIIFFLDVPLEVLKSREQPGRIYSAIKSSSLEDIYVERRPLYCLCSDYKIECSNKTVEEICAQIVRLYQALSKGD